MTYCEGLPDSSLDPIGVALPSWQPDIQGPDPRCVCVCVCVCVRERERERKKRVVAGQKQPLGAVWCKTRLFNSCSQSDQLCNLIGGAILARSTMLAHSRAITAYGDGRPRSKVRASVCVCGGGGYLRLCVCLLIPLWSVQTTA